jgi:hypothetical protein
VEPGEHIGALRAASARLSAAAAAAGPDAVVPSCPGWAVRDLVRHQGGVHRWASGIVGTPRTEPWDADLDEIVGSWPGDADLIAWFDEGAENLAWTLAGADPGLVCWTFLTAPSPLAMWSRRPGGKLRTDPARQLRVRCTDTEGQWLVMIGPDRVVTTSLAPGESSAEADCEIAGPAGDLYLALWNRRPASALTLGGDAEVLGLFLDRVRIRWS